MVAQLRHQVQGGRITIKCNVYHVTNVMKNAVFGNMKVNIV